VPRRSRPSLPAETASESETPLRIVQLPDDTKSVVLGTFYSDDLRTFSTGVDSFSPDFGGRLPRTLGALPLELRVLFEVHPQLTSMKTLFIDGLGHPRHLHELALGRQRCPLRSFPLIANPRHGTSRNVHVEVLGRLLGNSLVCPIRVSPDDLLDMAANLVDMLAGLLEASIILKNSLQPQKPLGTEQLKHGIAMKPTNLPGNLVCAQVPFHKLNGGQLSLSGILGMEMSHGNMIQENGLGHTTTNVGVCRDHETANSFGLHLHSKGDGTGNVFEINSKIPKPAPSNFSWVNPRLCRGTPRV